MACSPILACAARSSASSSFSRSFIEEEETIKKILLHLDLWMPGNHDPPNLYNEQQYIPASKPSGPSYDTTHDDYVLQMPYEDEYSQLTPYEDCI